MSDLELQINFRDNFNRIFQEVGVNGGEGSGIEKHLISYLGWKLD